MRAIILSASAATLIGLTMGMSATPASAYVYYPWCAHYGGKGGGGAANCGFVTREQCMATVSGSQGTCEMNPFGPPTAQTRKRRASRDY
jgi:hypothetical protein